MKRFTSAIAVVALLVFVVLGYFVWTAVGTPSEPSARPLAVVPNANPATETATVAPTLPPTNTPDIVSLATVDPSVTASPTTPATATATATPQATATPTSLPQLDPILEIDEPLALLEGIPTPVTPIPTAVAPFHVPVDVTNVLLLGSDTDLESGDTRTDTMIIVSVSHDRQTASMVSLPRDLFVYIPGRIMGRLNSSMTLGGVELLKQTILYNFGIPIHYYARVDFDGFQGIIDAMGGVTMNISCEFSDWRLIEQGLDVEDPENWEISTLDPGVYDMDGDTALWYARSRLLSSDFDRGRRQQQLLRAMLNQGVDLGMASQVPQLWSAFQESVETDMDIGRLLQLATLAPTIRDNGVQNLYLNQSTQNWTIPDTGAQVQLPVWEGHRKMQETLNRLFLPPALNRSGRDPIYVEIINGTGNPDMAILAADNLAWYGFLPVLSEDVPAEEVEFTTLTYYAPNLKGSYDWLITWIVDIYTSQIILAEDSTYAYNYKLVLGEDYDPCVNGLYPPTETIE